MDQIHDPFAVGNTDGSLPMPTLSICQQHDTPHEVSIGRIEDWLGTVQSMPVDIDVRCGDRYMHLGHTTANLKIRCSSNY